MFKRLFPDFFDFFFCSCLNLFLYLLYFSTYFIRYILIGRRFSYEGLKIFLVYNNFIMHILNQIFIFHFKQMMHIFS